MFWKDPLFQVIRRIDVDKAVDSQIDGVCFVEVAIGSKASDLKIAAEGTPLLMLKNENCSPEKYLAQVKADADTLGKFGAKTVVIAADRDSLLMQYLSPRSSSSSLEWFEALQSALTALKEANFFVGCAICIDELCPGGIDLTEGLNWAHSLEEQCVDFLVLSCGTKDFPALFDRRRTYTKEKKLNLEGYISEPWLASAIEISKSLSVPCFAFGNPNTIQNVPSLLRGSRVTGIVLNKCN